VELFSTRAQLPPSDEIAELCARLDALPLALELAAARCKALTVAQILERLSQRLDLLKGGRDAEARHETLRATIAWSYDLLSPEEQRLFARLAVFRGGCTLEAAEQVAGADLDTLQSLVEKSLLRYGDGRYWMLETIRNYAGERLDESGDSEQLRHRHAEAFLALAEESVPHLRSADPTEWLDRVGVEHDNLRAALTEFEARGESQLVLRLAGSLASFWFLREHVVEGRLRLDSAIAADDRPTAARARALNGASLMAQTCGDFTAGREFATEALTLYRRLGDDSGVATSTRLLGHAAVDLSDWVTAQQHFDESLHLFRELGDENAVLMTTDILAYAYYRLGDRARTLALVGDNLRLARATQNRRMEATSLGALGLYAVEDGRLQDAVAPLAESTRLWREIADWEFDEVGLNLCSIARVLADQGSAEGATRLISAAVSWHDEIGAAPRTFTAALNEKTLAIIHQHLDEAAFAEAWEQGARMTPDEAVEYALASID
jgi:predicted ATPase